MSRLTPLSWKDFVKKMNKLGFEGPFQEGKHPI
jgi:predicted RNA binding protein YcfA (HicA-like mRNA interferase family)